jgi:type I restriction enzyme M protein
MSDHPKAGAQDESILRLASDDGATPRRRRGAKARPAQTSKQRLSATIKSVRDLLRKDAGLSGEADRLPQLALLLFLKFVDDHELAREDELGDRHVPIIEPPYRWRDWAGRGFMKDALKGDELIEFVNQRLILYLRDLSDPGERGLRTIIGEIFQGNFNRVRSGAILREVIDKLSTINFNASDDIHTVSYFYETMLREMRDAAGDSGEFYTIRPLVRLIIHLLDPKLGEVLLDPAGGTCGFLAEGYDHLKDRARDPEQRRKLQASIQGIEKKPMPYLLGVTNLLLHGIEVPNLREANALTTNVKQIRDEERVEVIATNPPFGGEEERGVLNNFPEGMRTQETAILFFQYVMAKLKRPGGRCGIILPNGFLFGDGVAAEVKKRLIRQFNLHTIVRLPNGVFAPYTSIPTNILFFEACPPDQEGPCTREVWYYEHPLPEGRKNYTKTQPLQYDEFGPLLAWWGDRRENERAWRVPIERIIENGYNLDLKNPHTSDDLEHLPPEQLVESILQKERRIIEIMEEIRLVLARGTEP